VSSITQDICDAVLAHVPAGGRIALSDGAGAPSGVLAGVVAAAEQLGDLEVICGWCLGDSWKALDHASVRVTTFMGGYGMRSLLRGGRARYVPLRLGNLPAAFHGPLRCDLVIASARIHGDRWGRGTEICWTPAAQEAGAKLVLVNTPHLPCGEQPVRPMDQVVAVVTSQDLPVQVPEAAVDDISAVIGERVAALLPGDAVVQYGPGAVGRAVLSSITRPVRVWSGVITDAVVELDRRGMLVGDPVATYAVGTHDLYDWIDGRSLLQRVEHTHDVTALAQAGIWAINTALEIDCTGQVNVERIGSDVIAGVGGHADFAMAGARSVRGASIIALPSHRGGQSTLVERLPSATSTSRSDVDMVITEHGMVDLRGLDDRERADALRSLWGW
jgi:hypothetical protein